MIRYDSTGDRSGSGVGIVINGYVYLKLVMRRPFLFLYVPCATIYLFPSNTAQSGEESILVVSLRGVITKQAAEIETLQNKVKELATTMTTTTSTSLGNTTATTIVPEDSQPAATAKLSEVSLLSFSLLSILAWQIVIDMNLNRE